MSKLVIELKNCNSIENGKIDIVENSLNIKYAINGTGKSSISKAIEYFINDNIHDTNKLLKLKPFKYRDDIDTNNPDVTGLELIDSVAIFNENYVNQYVFQPNELLKNSFDIFINNEEYKKGIHDINELIKEISKTFQENEEIEIMINDLTELFQSFGKAKGIAKSGTLYKAIGKGNPVANIPIGLEVYKDFIGHSENTKWFKWQMMGKDYLEISDCCPYCTSSSIEDKKETISLVEKKYDSKLIEHLNSVIKTVSKLQSYFTEDTYEKIIKISQSVDGLQKEQEAFMLEIKEQIDTLLTKLKSIKLLGFQSLKEFDKVIKVITSLKIDMGYISHLNTESTSDKIEKINNSLDEILEKSGQLQGKVKLQEIRIKENIEEYKDDINNFLQYAGYKYLVDINEDDNSSYKINLIHSEFTESNIDNANNHLSYGEKNAFALILFMFDTLKNNQKLIILDDPISSFDKNKKFAIIEKLFRGEKSFINRTVLMLTHDFEPIVDIILHHSDIFNKVKPNASYLENIEGILSEKVITKDDIKTFIDIAKENILTLDEQINKLIYLRRLHEIQNDKGSTYHLLSSMFKKKEVPEHKSSGNIRIMTPCEIDEATQEITNNISEIFKYNICYNQLINDNELIRLYEKTTNNYEKLQIYRILHNDNSHDNRTIRKFINETFHIENDYIYQLNPCKYQTIPYYIIKECNKDIEVLKSGDIIPINLK